MYSSEDRIRAVELYIKLGKRVAATIRQLGYPTKNALKGWHWEYAFISRTARRRRVAVQRNGIRSEPLTPHRFREESLGRNDIEPDAEPEVDRLSRAANCTVTIDPFATDFHIRPRRLSMTDQQISQTGPSAAVELRVDVYQLTHSLLALVTTGA
jgi:transposase-like protein